MMTLHGDFHKIVLDDRYKSLFKYTYNEVIIFLKYIFLAVIFSNIHFRGGYKNMDVYKLYNECFVCKIHFKRHSFIVRQHVSALLSVRKTETRNSSDSLRRPFNS